MQRESIWKWVHTHKKATILWQQDFRYNFFHTNHFKLYSNWQRAHTYWCEQLAPHTTTYTPFTSHSNATIKRSKWYHGLEFAVTICNLHVLQCVGIACVALRLSQYRMTVWLMGFWCLLYETFDWCRHMNTRKSLWYNENWNLFVTESQI